MPFFSRLRELAAAAGAPGARPAAGLEVDATRVAAAGWQEAAARSAPPARVTEGGEPEVRWPASAGRGWSQRSRRGAGTRPRHRLHRRQRRPKARRRAPSVKSIADRLGPAAPEPAGSTAAPPVTSARNGDAVAPHDGVVARHDHRRAAAAARPAAARGRSSDVRRIRVGAPRPATDRDGRPGAAAPPRVVTASRRRPPGRRSRPASQRDPPVAGRDGRPRTAARSRRARLPAATTGRLRTATPRSAPTRRSSRCAGDGGAARPRRDRRSARRPAAARRRGPDGALDRHDPGDRRGSARRPPPRPVRSIPSPPPRRDAVPRDYLLSW